ncbi:MAG TPA: GNAT family N-acetyltransferase [Xanthobacteraceae bacterium]|nr:GNAT family N-acetyltransferase [Xanthobacteraceae bacterium]
MAALADVEPTPAPLQLQRSAEDLRAIELVHVRAWPALETADVQGWLWRYSGGGSQRANSVSTVSFRGDDAAVALDEVEARYRARGVLPRFHTYDLTEPAGLTDLLQARGYVEGESTITMAMPVASCEVPADVTVADRPDAEWREVYLGAITESRRAINAKILPAVPSPCAWLSCRRGGQTISSGLCVAGGALAVIECMATRAQARRQGGADAVLAGIEAWAAARGVRTLALQVVAANPPALALYRRRGFAPVATNRFWTGTAA